VQVLLADILDVCILPPDAHRLLKYTALVEQMTASLPNCQPFQNTMLSAASSQKLQDQIWKLIGIAPERGPGTCCAYAMSLQQKHIKATIALLLNVALGAQSNALTFTHAIAAALIKKQGSLPNDAPQCSHTSPTSRSTRVSLFQQNGTPYTGQHLQDWRDRLSSELESQGHYQRDSIVRSVAQICQDLEARCDTVEEPLRQEKARSQELERQLAELNARVVSLEVEATDDRLHLEGLEDEKLNISDERDSLAAKLRELQKDAEEASRTADEMLHKAHKEFNAKEMEFRSTILTHEEDLRSQARQIEDQSETVCSLRSELQDVRDQHSILMEQHETLQDRLAETEQKLNGESDINRTRSKEIATLRERGIELELQLQGTEAELDTVMSRLSDLQISHQELIHSSEEAYKDLETKYVNDMDEAAIKAEEVAERLRTEVREATQRAQKAEEAHDTTQQDLRQLQATIPPLEDRVQELNDFCTEQEEELEELRTMRRNLLAGLGVTSQHPLAIRPGSRAQADAAERTPRAPREHRRRKSAIQTLQGTPKVTRSTQGTTNTAMETLANASFGSSDSHSSQNGSTRKRSKPRSSFKASPMQTPYTQKPVLSVRSVSKKLSPSKRSALRQLSPNRRHTTVGFAVSENEEEHDNGTRSVRKRIGSLQGIEEADFDMEDFLAGTPLTPGNFATGTGRIPDDDDATTTELWN
jgi:predicted  nucleic acid-binding Zn-ribbon protein